MIVPDLPETPVQSARTHELIKRRARLFYEMADIQAEMKALDERRSAEQGRLHAIDDELLRRLADVGASSIVDYDEDVVISVYDGSIVVTELYSSTQVDMIVTSVASPTSTEGEK